VKYRFVQKNKHQYAVRTICRVLGLPVSGYYAWTLHPESIRRLENLRLMDEIKDIHQSSHQTYGCLRITHAFRKMGSACSLPRAARLMWFMCLRAKTARKFNVTTNSSHHEPIAPNLLEQDFFVDAPNKVWINDITDVRTSSGRQYLTIILELFNRQIIGYSLSNRLTAPSTINAALEMAVLHRRPPEGIMLHSERGIQYASKAIRKILSKYRMLQSMSGKGNCYDNAVT
jgi:putative transposase